LQLLEKGKRKGRRKRESIDIIITTIAAIEMNLRTPRMSGDISGEREKMLMTTEAADQSIDEDQRLPKSEEEDLVEIEITREQGVEIRLRQFRGLLLENSEDPLLGNDEDLPLETDEDFLLRNGEDPLIAGSHTQ
jgi:hypothetical protein